MYTISNLVRHIYAAPNQNTFYNFTIEVVEVGAFLSMKYVFLVTPGAALLVLFGLLIHGQIQHLSKKKKELQKLKLGLKLQMPQWMSGFRELHIPNLYRANLQRSRQI
ncbi:translocon-associated protein subunit alpha-like [Gastrolobium bilobum]|uniref:translocon-associated protein subunit alpha-like n=1 Tax=Gastrolobium bilobum TaxID=150636 RepID=UPI002AB276E2|nr:translocon-associated protein subunit alpha-like [Gastrolobium bilobum]